MKLLTAGESHGKRSVCIIEGLPAGAMLDEDMINAELFARQQGYGRGGRMKIETDKIEVYSGIIGGKTIGSPLSFGIENKDYANWEKYMSPFDGDISGKALTAVRPGHADLSGMIKYGFDNARPVLERASARETAARVAAGAICKQILLQLGITVKGEVKNIGGETETEKQRAAIDAARKVGDTLGGAAQITIKGMPIGVGSYVQFDRKLDAVLAMHLMSIQSVKAVEVGLGTEFANLKGSEAHDEIYIGGRKTNRAGGIEGGMSNGEDIVLTVTFKPIPTLMKGLDTVDVKTGAATKAASERSDCCAVEAATVVAMNAAAFAILDEIIKTFGGDRLDEIKARIADRRKDNVLG